MLPSTNRKKKLLNISLCYSLMSSKKRELSSTIGYLLIIAVFHICKRKRVFQATTPKSFPLLNQTQCYSCQLAMKSLRQRLVFLVKVTVTLFVAGGGGCTTYISGTGTCHREGYLSSRYWYKERYQFSQFWYKERYLFSRFLYEIHKVRYNFSKNWYKVGYTFP